MRRIKLILSAAAAMAVLMVLTAAPALADVEFNGGNIGSSGGGFTSVGNLGSGDIEIGDTDIGDNDIDFDDGVSSLGDGVVFFGNLDGDLGDCVVIDGVLFCEDNGGDDFDFIGGPGISQSFEQEDVTSGDVTPTISIG